MSRGSHQKFDQHESEELRKILELSRVPIHIVDINGNALMNIVQHCGSNLFFKGQLFGIDLNGIIEVTCALALPEEEEASYIKEMSGSLDAMNVDNNFVGFYISSFNGNHIDKKIIEEMEGYQQSHRNIIMLIYDSMVTTEGSLSLKAYKLKENALKLLKDKDRSFTKRNLRVSKFSYLDFFEEIPVRLSNYSLSSLMILNLRGSFENFDGVYSDNGYLNKTLDGMVRGISSIGKEYATFLTNQKATNKLEVEQNEFIEKRKQENEIRKNKNQTPLNESRHDLEVENPKLFRKPIENNRFDNLLLNHQIHHYCDQIDNYLNK